MNNNIYTNNNFIGSTHLDGLKPLSNLIISTSNILEQHIAYSNISSSNFTLSTSNILETHSSNFTNNLRYDVNKWINEEVETSTTTPPINLTHTYIYNSNLLGEIRFYNTKAKANFPNEYLLGTPNYRVKIDGDGKLKLYYTYDILINLTWDSGWIDPANMIVGLVADSFNQGGLISGLEAQIAGLIEETSAIYPKISLIDAEIADVNAKIIVIEEQVKIIEDALFTDSLTDSPSSIREELESISSFGSPSSTIPEAQATQELQNINTTVVEAARAHNTTRIGQMGTTINEMIIQNPLTSFALGSGATGVGILYGIIQNASIDNILNGIVQSNINCNSFLSSNKKRELLELNSNVLIASNLVDMTTNYYKLGLVQGFLNSNITTQQYLSNLKCDNLYLNNGNISGINYVNVNNIVADGKIKENNKFLDTTYLTSNHIYNLAYNYTAERQYPSKLYTTTSIQDTVSLLGKLVYHQILYLDNQSIAYGSGFYELYSSSTYDTPTTKDRLFNHNTSETTTSPRFAINLYNSGTGNYQADNSIVSGYFGDWVIIKMPKEILLTRYRIYQRSDFLTKAPAEWKVYGSNDGITFTEITEASQMTRLSSYTSGFYEKTLASTFTTQYQYFGFTFGKLLSTSGQTDLSFSELQLFGKEIISNSIVSNIYTTSNICKNLIIYDTPEVCKHFAFYILINTPIVIGSTTYYKYDIDLRQYTKKGYIQIGSGSNDPYRIFKIRGFYASSYFGTLVGGLPDVIYADIFMSFKAAGSALGQAGLNVCSIGNISNPSLTAVPPNNLFFMRNGANSIDHITVVSKSVADVRVVIEDLLS